MVTSTSGITTIVPIELFKLDFLAHIYTSLGINPSAHPAFNSFRAVTMSAPQIDHLTLPDGHTVPWLAFGSGTALIRQDVSNQMLLALQCGFTHLDTATFYSNEESVGAGIARASSELSPPIPRSSIFITTKLAELDPNDPAGVEGCLRASLTKLQVEYVDLYLIHVPRLHQQYAGRIGEVWREMVGVRDKGLAKSIGVSNFKIKHMEEIRVTGLEMPAVNQVTIRFYPSDMQFNLFRLSCSSNTTSSYAPSPKWSRPSPTTNNTISSLPPGAASLL